MILNESYLILDRMNEKTELSLIVEDIYTDVITPMWWAEKK